MKVKKTHTLFIVIIVLLVTIACGSTTTGEKVGENSTAVATTASGKMETFKVGDIVKVDDYTITLNSAQVSGSNLIANFTIDNTAGSQELTISSLMSFEAKDSEGNKLDFTICDGSQLDGSVLVGDRLKGNVCWKGVKTGANLKIYYQESFLNSGAIVWDIGAGTTGQVIPDENTTTSVPVNLETFKIGDVVKVEDYTITLNSAQVTGSNLIANFTIDNTNGSQELTISSLMSFEAKDSEGNKLDTTICEGSQLDGNVLVGDKLKGDVCWNAAKAGANIKIYYQASFLNSGAIVWDISK